MTNIKNNKLFSLGEASRFYQLSTKNVPFFINPNGIAKLETASSQSCKEQLEAKNLAAAFAAAQLIQPKPKLVFLQKKGSQIPNPNIISYNFPATSSYKHKINTVAGV